jgi:hypothetical protein
LEQNPEHRDHRTYRHRHHFRSIVLHRRVKKSEIINQKSKIISYICAEIDHS